jgi:DNA-binding response OmpR family regulator
VEINAELNGAWRLAPAAAPENDLLAPKVPSDREISPAVPADILVVDDDPDTLDAVAASLELEGWTVRRAHSGAEALRMAAEQLPDLAVIDLIMPEMSGEEVCAAMRRDPELSRTRLLVLSAAEDARIVAANCDADGAVLKPFTIALLLHEARRLLT